MVSFSKLNAVLSCIAFVAIVCRLASALEEPEVSADRKVRLKEMHRRAQELQVRSGSSKESQLVKMKDEPLLRFADPTRDFYDGGLFA